MSYRTFTRTWWLDNKCTKPGAGRKNYRVGGTYATESEAREACREYNTMRFGSSRRGPKGLCMEYESY